MQRKCKFSLHFLDISVGDCPHAFPAIDDAEEKRLRNRRAAFIEETGTRKGCHVTMVTTYGIKRNRHSGIIQSQVTMDQLFAN